MNPQNSSDLPSQPTMMATPQRSNPNLELPSQPLQPQKLNKKKIVLTILLAALVITGVAAYAVYAYVTNTPEYVLKRATEQLSNENIFSIKFSVRSGTVENGTTTSGDISVLSDPDNPKNGEAVIDLEVAIVV